LLPLPRPVQLLSLLLISTLSWLVLVLMLLAPPLPPLQLLAPGRLA
jgi:hypothetical protein